MATLSRKTTKDSTRASVGHGAQMALGAVEHLAELAAHQRGDDGDQAGLASALRCSRGDFQGFAHRRFSGGEVAGVALGEALERPRDRQIGVGVDRRLQVLDGAVLLHQEALVAGEETGPRHVALGGESQLVTPHCDHASPSVGLSASVARLLPVRAWLPTG